MEVNGRILNITARISPHFSHEIHFGNYILCKDFLRHANDIEEARIDVETSDGDTDKMMKDINFNDSPTSHVCICYHDLVKSSTNRVLKFGMKANFFARMVVELKRSAALRKNLLIAIFRQYQKRCKKHELSIQDNFCWLCQTVQWQIHISVSLKMEHNDIIDKYGNKRFQILVNEKYELETAMAWLSTLGGAFSSLGDFHIDFAKKAEQISIQQLKIALRLGDPLTVGRCQIYIAMSLLQLGHYKETKQLIRKLYEFSVAGEGKNDFRLKNMCIAVQNRLKYMLHIKKNFLST